MRYIPTVVAIMLLIGTVPALVCADTANDHTVVVANTAVPESMAVAEHYADVRGTQVLYISIDKSCMSPDYRYLYGGSAKYTSIANQILDYCEANSCIYIVTTYGMPIEAQAVAGSSAWYAFDNCIAGGTNTTRSNRLYRKTARFTLNIANSTGQYIVGRLDGPTPEIAYSLVDRAYNAEMAHSLAGGTMYFDSGGPYPTWDPNIVTACNIAKSRGFKSVLNTNSTLMTNLPDCAYYYGWYSSKFTGNFSLRPGAVAIHVYSFSASNLRSTSTWCGGFLAAGAAATIGAVEEPYLEYYCDPDKFIDALTSGKNVGESFVYASASLNWRMILIGDPLYNPYGTNIDPAAGDTTPPSFGNIAIGRTGIQFTTSEPAGCWVTWSSGSTQVETTPSTAHVFTMKRFVKPIVLHAKDAAGNESTQSVQ